MTDDEFTQVVLKIVEFNEGFEFASRNQFSNQMTVIMDQRELEDCDINIILLDKIL